MKKLLFIVAAFIAITFVACGGGAMDPHAFNNTAMKKFEEANKALDKFDAKITEGVRGNDLASIATAAEAALKEIDVQLEEMKAINAPENGEAYKNAVVKALETTKELVEIGKKYSVLPEGYSNSEFNALENEYNAKRKQLSQELSQIASVQAEFAKAVNAKK